MPHTRKDILQIGKEIADKIFHGKKEETETVSGWIARDDDGSLYFYKQKPIKTSHSWYHSKLNYYKVLADISSVKWEDEEPTPCTITIKIEK